MLYILKLYSLNSNTLIIYYKFLNKNRIKYKYIYKTFFKYILTIFYNYVINIFIKPFYMF